MFFFDSYAIIEVLEATARYQPLAQETITTTALNLGETYYYYLRLGREKEFLAILSRVRVELLDITPEQIYRAMEFKYAHRQRKFSFIDSVGYIIAEESHLPFLTGDAAFQGMPNVHWVH